MFDQWQKNVRQTPSNYVESNTVRLVKTYFDYSGNWVSASSFENLDTFWRPSRIANSAARYINCHPVSYIWSIPQKPLSECCILWGRCLHPETPVIAVLKESMALKNYITEYICRQRQSPRKSTTSESSLFLASWCAHLSSASLGVIFHLSWYILCLHAGHFFPPKKGQNIFFLCLESNWQKRN